MKRRIVFLLLLFLVSSCVKETEWSSSDPVPVRIVVEGIVTDRKGEHRVRISQIKAELNAEPEAVTGANVLVSNEDSVWSLYELGTDPGYYATNPGFVGMIGKNYTLQIFYKDKVYSARDLLVEGSFFSELQYKRNDDDDLFQIDYVASAFNSGKPAMWEILLDWSQAPGYGQSDPAQCRARILFYSLPTLDVTEVFAPVVEQVAFPEGTIITENRYSLSPAHAEYIRQMMLETNWQGGLFPTSNANVATNLSSGAIGFFAASAVTTISLTVSK